MADSFHRVIEASKVEERALLDFVVNGWPVVIGRDDGALHAVINRCTHQAAPLSPGGRVRRGAIMCPLHGARFNFATGECLGGSGYKALKVYPLRETEDGWIEVAVPDEAPGAEHLPVKPLA